MEEYLDAQSETVNSQARVKEFFTGVYTFMFMALFISGAVSYYMASSGLFTEWFINYETQSISPVFYVVMFAPLGLV